MAITKPIVNSNVRYYPNSVDAEAGNDGATVVPAIVNRATGETLTADMRLMSIDTDGSGRVPQRLNVKHKSEAQLEAVPAVMEGEEVVTPEIPAEAYWDWE